MLSFGAVNFSFHAAKLLHAEECDVFLSFRKIHKSCNVSFLNDSWTKKEAKTQNINYIFCSFHKNYVILQHRFHAEHNQSIETPT